MAWFFSSGAVVILILLVMAGEFAALVTLGKKPVLSVVLTLGPGVAFMLALLAALTGASWHWIAIWLTVSLPLHLADLRHRRLI